MSEFERQFPPYEKPLNSTIDWAENNIRTYESITIRQYQKEGYTAALKCVQQKSLELMDITYLQQWLVKEIEKLESGK